MNWQEAKVELLKGRHVNRTSLMKMEKISEDVNYMGTEAVSMRHGFDINGGLASILVGADTLQTFEVSQEDYEANDWITV